MYFYFSLFTRDNITSMSSVLAFSVFVYITNNVSTVSGCMGFRNLCIDIFHFSVHRPVVILALSPYWMENPRHVENKRNLCDYAIGCVYILRVRRKQWQFWKYGLTFLAPKLLRRIRTILWKWQRSSWEVISKLSPYINILFRFYLAASAGLSLHIIR